MSTGVATLFACVVVLLGPGSAAMHATQSEWGGHLDMLSMYLVAGFAAAWAWTRWTRLGTAGFVTAYVACVAACELIGLWPDPVPVVNHSGNLAFGVLLLGAVALETALWRRGETSRVFRHGVVAVTAMVVAFGIWLLSNAGWCDPDSLLQGHAAWHLLCAVAAYWLFRLHASELRAHARPGRRRRLRRCLRTKRPSGVTGLSSLIAATASPSSGLGQRAAVVEVHAGDHAAHRATGELDRGDLDGDDLARLLDRGDLVGTQRRLRPGRHRHHVAALARRRTPAQLDGVAGELADLLLGQLDDRCGR